MYGCCLWGPPSVKRLSTAAHIKPGYSGICVHAVLLIQLLSTSARKKLAFNASGRTFIHDSSIPLFLFVKCRLTFSRLSPTSNPYHTALFSSPSTLLLRIKCLCLNRVLPCCSSNRAYCTQHLLLNVDVKHNPPQVRLRGI